MSAALFFDDNEIFLLREILGNVPLNQRYIGFVSNMLQRLPEESVAAGSSADSSRAAPADPETARGFQLIPQTARGCARLPAIESLLSMLPHGDSL